MEIKIGKKISPSFLEENGFYEVTHFSSCTIWRHEDGRRLLVDTEYKIVIIHYPEEEK